MTPERLDSDARQPRRRLGEVLERAEQRLRTAGIDQPALEARILLGHVLGIEPLRVALARERAVAAAARSVIDDLVAERCRRRPIQHLLGDVEFYGRSFRVGPGVLIPRPETESLVEVVLRELPPQPGPAAATRRVAEVGCGAGIIAATLACERPALEVWCSDLEARAVRLTELNVAALGVAGRVHARRGDLLQPLRDAAPFAMLVSNPPYIPSAAIAALAPEVRDHDPQLALDGGPDGLRVTRRLLEEAPAVLAPAGCLVVELGYDQGAAAAALARERGWREVAVLPDLAGRDRVLRARRPPPRDRTRS